ncbi:LpqB family beta-propeller domain-containing protein [Streptomyces sp. NPDC090306]|uniref:LpqB family beta-propeller domain-containing protein n=1 Tax=Streptomyces sp. NPDC090306 TaxID=3365961 RepID=UPI0038073C50
MGAEREGGARRRPGRAMAYAACGVVLLAGCASMPDSGDLRDVESTPRQETQVRVFAMPPREDAPPSEIVQGFLEAVTSDDPNYATARQYLTESGSKLWRPESATTVLADGPEVKVPAGERQDRQDGRSGSGSYGFELSGTRVATVDDHQSYTAADGVYRAPVHLVQDKKTHQWRIDTLPQGIVVGKSDFQRNYMSVNKYFFASGDTGGQPTAVADPVYVRRRVDPMTQMVRSLLEGPTSWLNPVVRSSFPTGTALKKGVTSLAPDDQNKLTIPLNAKASRVSTKKCDEMATQILFTLQNLSPAVDEVELQRSNGTQLCVLGADDAEVVASHGAVKRPEYVYYLDSKHRVVRMAGGVSGTHADPVPGELGTGDVELQSVAVARDEHTAAGVSLDGKQLYVGSLVSGGSLGDPVLTSAGKDADDRLTTPSWDARGDLWVADRDPARPRLLMLKQGAGDPVEIKVAGLDGRIDAVRVAADGVRIALVVEKGGKRSLFIGRIDRDETNDQAVEVRELRSAAPDLEDTTAMSWAGDSRLVVVGREKGGVQQVQYVQVDGSTPEGQAPAALTGVKQIAASEDERLPLVAYSEDGIVRLPTGAQWQKVVKDASAPVYPG